MKILIDDKGGGPPSEWLFLHGRLEATVHEAKGLPDTDRGLGFNLVPGDLTDPFVSAYLGEARIFKTRYVKNQTDPHWNESFSVNVCHHATSLEIKVIAVLSQIYWLF